jgi:hypothetical protein
VTGMVANGIGLLALGVSGVSLYISWMTHRRAEAAERVTGWIDIQRTDTAGWYIGAIDLTNPS